MDKLQDFILRSSGERWELRCSDCCPWVLRWVTACTGKSVQVPGYSSDREALAMIREAGSLALLIERFCQRLELPETISPDRGDVGVIANMRAMSGQTIGIYTGDGRYAVRVRCEGIARTIITKAKGIRAWSVQ